MLSETSETHTISFDYGQRHRRELESAKKISELVAASHKEVDISSVQNLLSGSALTDDIAVPDGHYAEPSMKKTVVPNRNLMMLSIAWGYGISIEADTVAAGVHAGDHFIYPDCRPDFIESAAKTLALATEALHQPNLSVPFLHKTKTDIAGIGSNLGVPYVLTWTCYKGGEVHCGTCGACVERQEAFRDSGITDPTVYAERS